MSANVARDERATLETRLRSARWGASVSSPFPRWIKPCATRTKKRAVPEGKEKKEGKGAREKGERKETEKREQRKRQEPKKKKSKIQKTGKRQERERKHGGKTKRKEREKGKK